MNTGTLDLAQARRDLVLHTEQRAFIRQLVDRQQAVAAQLLAGMLANPATGVSPDSLRVQRAYDMAGDLLKVADKHYQELSRKAQV